MFPSFPLVPVVPVRLSEVPMVFTKAELISALQKECRILVHLATKVDRSKLDYRLTPKQRSTMEWFQYMSLMGANLVRASKAGGFDPAAWAAEEKVAFARDFDQTVAAIAGLGDIYAQEIGGMSDADFRQDVTFFGTTQSRGAFLVNVILCGHAAYRTQLFNYLKACGREELTTMNLWAGMDAPAA
jgi:hypothetical protein